MKKTLIIFLSISLFSSLDMVSQSKKELRIQKEKEEYLEIKKLIESGEYIFDAKWAISKRGKRFDLNGYIIVVHEKMSASNLPFYGESSSGAPYDGGGMEFKNLNTEFDITYDDEKNKISINFKANKTPEHFKVTISIKGNGSSTVIISSNSRSTMNYSGNIEKLPEEMKKDKK